MPIGRRWMRLASATGNPVRGLMTGAAVGDAATCEGAGASGLAGLVAAETTAGSAAEPGSDVAAVELALVTSGVAACELGATFSESP